MSGEVIRQGYKSPSNPDSRLKAWQKRWCVLYESHMLKYYVDESAFRKRDDPKGYVNLNDCSGGISTDIPREIARKRKGHLFVVATPSRRYYFVADSDAEQRAWIADISRLIGVTPLVGDNAGPVQKIEESALPVKEHSNLSEPLSPVGIPPSDISFNGQPMAAATATSPILTDPPPQINRGLKPSTAPAMSSTLPYWGSGQPSLSHQSQTLPLDHRPLPSYDRDAMTMMLGHPPSAQRYNRLPPRPMSTARYDIPPRPQNDLYKVPSSLPSHPGFLEEGPLSPVGMVPSKNRKVKYTDVEMVQGHGQGKRFELQSPVHHSRTQYSSIDMVRTEQNRSVPMLSHRASLGPGMNPPMHVPHSDITEEMYSSMMNGVHGDYYTFMQNQFTHDDSDIYSGASEPMQNGDASRMSMFQQNDPYKNVSTYHHAN
eukprot:m.123544 g.123544  ORF g.123544 m.123544 type:complete len:429 (+) comp37823_c0_seq24:72-1358(+)